MSQQPGKPGDPYARVEYRRLIAWEARIAREGPWLQELLALAPDRSVVDLGCGTGEHTAFFAREGARAVGLDSSEEMIESARDHEARGAGTFVVGDALDAAAALEGHEPFGLAICLGNMLPHILEEDDLARFAASVRSVLQPGGLLLIQLLNYARYTARGERHLPLNFREGEDGEEIVFLRLMSQSPDGKRVLFFPTTLVLDEDSEEPVSVKMTRRVELRGWTAAELGAILGAQGFEVALHGGMNFGLYEPEDSRDLVVVAKRL